MDTSYYKKYEPIFGKWHIVRELGEGSFGKVFEIEHRDLSGTYSSALKVITIPRNKTELAQVASENTGPDGVTKYFRSIVDGITKEFNIMSQLKGESTIVSYEDHEVREHTDGIGWDIFIRMELLTPLLQYTAAYPLSRNDIIRLGIDICSALELCRKNAIIHRDIKPENIFVSKNGRFKLGDFGIAKNIDKTTSELTKTGTYTYMAPEVYKGEAYGASVDIYSLGIVLYNYTNNGRSPFISATQSSVLPAEKTEALLRRMKGEALPAPANADEALSRVILKACAYLPRDRYLTPTDMRRDLEALLDGRSVGVSSLDKTVGIFGNRSTATTEAPAEKPSPSDVTEPDSKTDSYCAEPLPSVSGAETVGIFSGSKRPAKSDSPAVAPSDKSDPDLSKPEKDDRTQPHSADNCENTPVNSGKHTESKTGKGIKILAATLAVCLVLAIGIFALVKSGVFSGIPNLNIGLGTSSDSVSGTCGDNLEWTFSGGTLTISGEGVMYDYEYDADLNSLAPWGDCEIEKIVIKTGVTGIGKYAFFKCDQLTKVTIPGSVTSIGYGAFESCTSLKSVTIPDGVTDIGDYSFNDCTSLTKITIPDTVTNIGQSAFGGCTSLKSVTFPDKLDSIDFYAFTGCTSLKSVTVPYCTNDIYYVFSSCTSLNTVTIADGVTYIGGYMFMECTSLKSVSIPASVTRIDATAFIGCDSLTDIYYSGSESQWNSISIEGGTTAHPSATVHYNSDSQAKPDSSSESESPTEITPSPAPTPDPGGVSGTCGDNVYWSFSNGTLTISGSGKMYDYSDSDSDNTSFNTTAPWGNHRDYQIKKVIIAQGVSSIGDCAFYGCTSLTSVTIPNSVTSIGSHAFFFCHNLTSITIPNSVTSIEMKAFSNSGLTSIRIPSSITCIEEYTFSQCFSLTSIYLPSSLTSIDLGAFLYCSNLADVYYSGSEAQWASINIGESNERLTSATVHYNS